MAQDDNVYRFSDMDTVPSLDTQALALGQTPVRGNGLI
jgi:hypothetical protein